MRGSFGVWICSGRQSGGASFGNSVGVRLKGKRAVRNVVGMRHVSGRRVSREVMVERRGKSLVGTLTVSLTSRRGPAIDMTRVTGRVGALFQFRCGGRKVCGRIRFGALAARVDEAVTSHGGGVWASGDEYGGGSTV